MSVINYQPTIVHNEEDLVIGLQQGDQRRFTQLYDKFSAAIFAVISGWINDTEVAENLLQEVFIKAWRYHTSYDPSRGRLFTWLYNIAHSLCIDYLRSKTYKKSKTSVLSNDIALLLPHSHTGSLCPDTIGLRKLLDTLRKEEKQVIELMYFEGFTQKEIADRMNMPLGTVKTRMNRGIKSLRYLFKKDSKSGMRIAVS